MYHLDGTGGVKYGYNYRYHPQNFRNWIII